MRLALNSPRNDVFFRKIYRKFLFSSISYFSTATDSLVPSNFGDRALNPDPKDQIQKRAAKVDSPPESRIAKTVILGCPNAGKSVLTNALVDAPVSAVSSKVHTTRKTTRGACLLNDRTQLFVLDTPGVVTSTRAKKHKLEDSLLLDPEGAMLGADTVLVLLDAADKRARHRLDPRILHLLYRHRNRLTSALILSKVDVVKDKGLLLDLATQLTKGIVGGEPVPAKETDSIMIRGGEPPKSEKIDQQKLDSEKIDNEKVEKINEGDRETADLGKNCDSESINETSPVDEMLRKHWTGVNWHMLNTIAALPWPQVQESALQKCYRDEVGWPLFDRIFMVSAINGQGVDELREYLNERARLGNWRLHPTMSTDQDIQELVKDIVRAKLMDRLLYHMPYTLEFKVCVWEVNENDVLCIRLDVSCPQERDCKFIIGPKGKTVSEAASDVTQVLRNLFQREVFFRLGVYHKKPWKVIKK